MTVLRDDTQLRVAIIFALVPIVISFLFVVFILYRKKREAFFRQQESELRFSLAEVEWKALRAQINPHFIFNCLNSIHHYILRNESKIAGDYLIKFSQLIRLILENSLHKSISLEDELHALQLYVQLEQMRLEHRFQFDLQVSASVNQSQTEVPPLLIQPFVENAIWHGLTNVADGKLHMSIEREENVLVCIIENSGRSTDMLPDKSQEQSGIVKKASLGLALVQERLDILNRSSMAKAFFTQSDIKDAKDLSGKRVELRIPVLDN